MRGRRGRPGAVAAGICTLVLLSLTAGTVPAVAAGSGASGASGGGTSWTEDIAKVGSDDVNVRWTAGGLRVRDKGFRPASEDGAQAGYGSMVLTAHTLDRPTDRVRVALDADVPPGAAVVVDVRGRDAGGAWTEWREADGHTAVLPRPVGAVQARITLDDRTAKAEVHGLRLTAEAAGATGGAVPSLAAATGFSARVYATREGLVGGTTANGHVIQSSDHFVALPSRRGLSPMGSSQYSVQVCGPARCETAPVWDVGPWNIHDDYWNPSSSRESFQDLAQGMPEAQAAYQNGYNGGNDGFGRHVANPAGIDLADGTFYNVGLNDNGWVTVTYLWTGGGTTTSFPTWGTDVRIHAQATTASSTVATLAGPTQVGVRCQVHGQTVTYQGYTNDAWSYLPAYGGYISNIFIDVPDAWLPGVPTC